MSMELPERELRKAREARDVLEGTLSSKRKWTARRQYFPMDCLTLLGSPRAKVFVIHLRQPGGLPKQLSEEIPTS